MLEQPHGPTARLPAPDVPFASAGRVSDDQLAVLDRQAGARLDVDRRRQHKDRAAAGGSPASSHRVAVGYDRAENECADGDPPCDRTRAAPCRSTPVRGEPLHRRLAPFAVFHHHEPVADTDNYTTLAGFEHVALEDSYVLDIAIRPYVLVIRLDLLLLPEHPAWEPPKRGERGCFKTAKISFSGIRSLHWTGMGARPARDSSGEVDFGSVDALTRLDRVYRIEGDWGAITLEAEAPRLSLEPTFAAP